MKFKELEKIVLADGWRYKGCVGSHHQQAHSVKPGKVTIPNHTGDISKAVVQSVLKQTGLKKQNELIAKRGVYNAFSLSCLFL